MSYKIPGYCPDITPIETALTRYMKRCEDAVVHVEFYGCERVVLVTAGGRILRGERQHVKTTNKERYWAAEYGPWTFHEDMAE